MKMKKLIAYALALSMAAGLAGCGSAASSGSAASAAPAASAAAGGGLTGDEIALYKKLVFRGADRYLA